MVDLSRRAMIGAVGLGIAGTAISWPRLTGADIPGRGQDALTITVFGTAQDAAQRQGLVDGFQRQHPDVPVRIVAIQGQDWASYFAKILTMVAAGNPPDIVTTSGGLPAATMVRILAKYAAQSWPWIATIRTGMSGCWRWNASTRD